MTVADQVREAMGDLYARPSERMGIAQLRDLAGGNRALVTLLGLPSDTKTHLNSSMRRLQRYETTAGQKRTPRNEDLRARLNAVNNQLTRDKMLKSEVTIYFHGELSAPSGEPGDRSFERDIEEPDEESLEAFLDALAANEDEAIEEALDGLVTSVYGGTEWHVEDAPELTFTVRPRA